MPIPTVVQQSIDVHLAWQQGNHRQIRPIVSLPVASGNQSCIDLHKLDAEACRYCVALLGRHARDVFQQEGDADPKGHQHADDSNKLEEQLRLFALQAFPIRTAPLRQVLARRAAHHEPRYVPAMFVDQPVKQLLVDLPDVAELRTPRKLLCDEPHAGGIHLGAVIRGRLDTEAAQGDAATTDAIEGREQHEVATYDTRHQARS
mmetsp:Transcript_113874/g.327225  ORF Transcript_113874/g.327225 Transcript_113874/m.327225 type:complete len:204 (+) Transcript_113874:473-1084(+)